MNSFLRSSTAPPNFLDEAGDGMSYFFNIYESPDQTEYDLFNNITIDILNLFTDYYKSNYAAVDSQDKEIGVLICYRDEEGAMYCCIDHAGRLTCQPAANEALWHADNAAADLPNGHRLPRLTQPIALG